LNKLYCIVLFKVVFKFLWSSKSSKDIGTLYQLMNVAGRSNVTGDVKHEMSMVGPGIENTFENPNFAIQRKLNSFL